MPDAFQRWTPPRQRRRETKERAHYRTADWRARRQRILIRDAFTCRDCGEIIDGKRAHVDHITPLEDGGTDHDNNLATRCDRCHGRKTVSEQRRRGHL